MLSGLGHFTALSDLSKFELDNLANILKSNENVVVELSGHTDSQGDDESNMELSENRAQNVMNYLTNKGLDESRLRYAGYGENSPIGDNNTEEGRELNRRTELKIISQ